MLIPSNSGRYVRRLTKIPSLAREGWFPTSLFSLFLLIAFPALFSHFPLSSRILLSCGFSLKKKESMYSIRCVRAPSEKWAQTLVFGVMLSVLMEV